MNERVTTALVTGANRGIGYEVAAGLARRGIAVTGTCRNAADGEAARARLSDVGLAVTFQVLDVTDDHAITALRDALGPVDLLVNNAGVALDAWRPSLETDSATLQASLDTNFIGAATLCRAFVPAMVEAGFGRVVNVSSRLGSLTEMTGLTLGYRASKAAMNVLTRVLADEVKDAGDVLVNSVCPGWTRTGLGGDEAPQGPEEAVDTILWLATLPAVGPTGGFFQEREAIPF